MSTTTINACTDHSLSSSFVSQMRLTYFCCDTQSLVLCTAKPGSCHPITLRGVPVFVTASCYSWGTGATFCADGCGGVQCTQVNGTATCTNVDFTFTSAWILGQCATGPIAPVAPVAEPVAQPVATHQPGVIPASQIVNQSGAITLIMSFSLSLGVVVLALFV